MNSIYDASVKATDGTDRSLKEFEGQVLLIVNTASGCGFAPQMEDLEELQKTYRDRGFTVLAFPSNDFFQEARFGIALERHACALYQTTFPIFDRVHVRGNERHPLFNLLTEQTGDWLGRPVRWNFEKFLVNRRGEVLTRWRSLTKPSSARVARAIEAALDARN